MDKCHACNAELSGERSSVACPNCGAKVRDYNRMVGEGILGLSGSVSWKQTRPGVNSTAELSDNGSVGLNANGSPPRNEEDADKVCLRLVRYLNSRGDHWDEIYPGERSDDVDRWAKSSTIPNDILKMQVVRATESELLWAALGRSKEASLRIDCNLAADDLMSVIKKKSAKYPPSQRRELTLVLDANRVPSHTFRQVHDSFRERHMVTCTAYEFRQIWIVGAVDDAVSRLDMRA